MYETYEIQLGPSELDAYQKKVRRLVQVAPAVAPAADMLDEHVPHLKEHFAGRFFYATELNAYLKEQYDFELPPSRLRTFYRRLKADMASGETSLLSNKQLLERMQEALEYFRGRPSDVSVSGLDAYLRDVLRVSSSTYSKKVFA